MFVFYLVDNNQRVFFLIILGVMAAKLLHSLADDNPDLQKQIGCMTGIFQIFERQHLISGRRPNQRRLLPPPSGSLLLYCSLMFLNCVKC